MELFRIIAAWIGIYLFSQGFLLVRLVLPDKSHAPTLNRRFNNTLLILIDALRYDFISKQNGTQHYKNKLRIVEEKLESEPLNSLLFKAIADPPTTTLQRLIALVTGCLPTLVDAGSNFGSFEILEDNLIHQLQQSGREVITMGDDTWNNLFPNRLNVTWPYPSFDVWDLHTVDEKVLGHLFPLLSNGFNGLAIAHFLGVDHAGHRYGPDHVAMGDKLVQMNQMLEKVFQQISNDTLVVVIGDHGMDSKGDHGGDSNPELESGLFFYSKTPLRGNCKYSNILAKRIEEIDSSLYHEFIANPERLVPQIDIVSSLSVLMGLPIPFGNLGMLIPELFDVEYNGLDCLQYLVETIRMNAMQVNNYMLQYGKLRADAHESFQPMYELFKKEMVKFERSKSEQDLVDSYIGFFIYLRKSLLICRSIWARFDVVLMGMGCILLALSGILCICRKPSTNFIYFILLGILLGVFLPLQSATMKKSHLVLFFGTFFGQLSFLPSASIPKNPLNVGSLIILMLCFLTASDSFTIFEDMIILFLMQSIHLVWFFEARGSKQVALAGMIVLTRLISLSTICRQDQGPYCIPTFNASPESSVASVESSYLAIICGIIWMLLNRGNKLYNSLGIAIVLIYAHLTTIGAQGFLIDAIWYPRIFWLLQIILLLTRKVRTSHDTLCFVLTNLCIFQKPMGIIMLIMGYFYVQLLLSFKGHANVRYLLCLLSMLLFYATGHQNTLPSIQYEMGFVGLESANYQLSPIFIFLNTFGGHVLIQSCLGLFEVEILDLLTFQEITSVVFAGHFMRHSQAWRVWGPKFLFTTGMFATGVFGYIISVYRQRYHREKSI